MQKIQPPKFISTYPRFKFTLILLALLFIGVAAKADVPCHLAINQQQATIDSLQQQLKTAQSVPYNQGYQEGYKVAKEKALITITWSGILTVLKWVGILALGAAIGILFIAASFGRVY